MEKVKYKTHQRDVLLNFLMSVKGQHITVTQVCEHLRQEGSPVGTTTVYRQLDKMVDEGLINKYITDANTPACYEYIGEDSECSEPVCFHLKCDECGKLIHLHCDELMGIRKHIDEEHGFLINSRRTVFYGICEECRKKTAD